MEVGHKLYNSCASSLLPSCNCKHGNIKDVVEVELNLQKSSRQMVIVIVGRVWSEGRGKVHVQVE